ncbi:MAG: 23S rRNA (guanosine(2251)-2'-O)-methyltransferase RlmB [Muribaculaceae bacterium]|nr:23S rRNA (guanosine(2251)-2'-O)-methyltransferase RlmB [Muribaculaceae bacterium]
MTDADYIYGVRAVIEAIDAGRRIDKVLIKRDLGGNLVSELMDKITSNGIVVQRVPLEKLNRITRNNHQGVVALLSAVSYYNIEDLIPELVADGRLPFVVILDGITDVRNFGAIARTAECAGVDALIIPSAGSVTVGADAVKTSAGALLRVPVCRVRNMAHAVTYLEEKGFSLVAVSEKADHNYTQGDYTVPTALIMGAEDKGISPHIFKACSTRVSIPMFGHIGSLNVSVAAGIMMYEVVRQRLEANMEVI